MVFKDSSDDLIEKYTRILEKDRIDMKQLRELAWKGIPTEYRSITWRLLLVRFHIVHGRRSHELR